MTATTKGWCSVTTTSTERLFLNDLRLTTVAVYLFLTTLIWTPYALLAQALILSRAPSAGVELAGSNPPAGSQPVATMPASHILHEGDSVPLRFTQALSSKTAAEGDPVYFELASDIVIDGVVVANAGSKAYGEVSSVKKAGMMGKGGELNVRLDYLKVGDKKVHLRGNKGKTGNDSTGSAVALTVLFGPIGLIKHGHNTDIKEGTELAAYASEDATLAAVPIRVP
jgi:hypothetical protein